jgi:Phage tail sheath protein subtilisin-like domain
MPEQTFKSPNFYEREIDLSAPSITGPVGVPAAVIGTSNKGPAFVPVTVANFSEFAQTFGNLDTKQFGPYAVNEFFKNRSALTYVRVLGAGANSSDADLSATEEYGTVKNAGFVLSGTVVGSDKRSPGVVQFLAAQHTTTANGAVSAPMFTENNTMDGQTQVNLVRGLIMSPDTARVMVLDSASPVTSVGSSLNDSTAVDASKKFKILISSSLGASFCTTDGVAGVKVLTASFDPSDKDYFGKILNTDPDKFYQSQHYLHADFAVDTNVAYVDASAPVAVLSGSSNASKAGDDTKFFREVFGSYNTRFTAPQTTSFISQPFGTTEYDLFKFEALDDGEYANSLYKISISNVKASVDEGNKYGTFNVQIRDWNDTDTNPNVLEQFTNCSLDPNSTNYIAKLIGDYKLFYNFDTVNPSEKRLVSSGKYPINSKRVRVIVSTDVERGNVPAEALPFGFRGPNLLNVNPLSKVTDVLSPAAARLGGQLAGAATSLSSSFLPPVPFRFKVTRGEIASSMNFVGEPGSSEQSNIAYYWGVQFERNSVSSDPNSTNVLNPNIVSEKNGLLESYTKFVGIEKLDALVTGSAADSLHNNKFSLANVALYNTSFDHLTSSVNAHMRQAAYVRNAKLDNSDYTWTENSRRRLTFGTLLSSGSASLFNRFSSYAKFTNFMFGGFDGTNFLNRDARRLNDKSVSFDDGGGASNSNDIPGFPVNGNPSGQHSDNNGVASYLTAVDIATSPMMANNNILAVPGIREPYVTDHTMQKVKDYGLAMYVMDIPSYDDDGNRLYDDSVAKPNINYTTNNFDSRAIDNNYAAVYYPDIFVDDATNRRKVKVPASVAAMSALGFNDRVTYPWFAPAGFNRAALDFVTNVAVRLNVSDRDRLYESRINPIATFPRLGYVIYGQKTLQINKSALDRVNVRRLLLEVKRTIIGIAQRIVFEQNTPAVRNKFVADASFQLALIQAQAGIEAFQVVCNESNNTQEDSDLNRLNGRIVVVPTRVVEYIAIDFIITNSGVQFV